MAMLQPTSRHCRVVCMRLKFSCCRTETFEDFGDDLLERDGFLAGFQSLGARREPVGEIQDR